MDALADADVGLLEPVDEGGRREDEQDFAGTLVISLGIGPLPPRVEEEEGVAPPEALELSNGVNASTSGDRG